jgi:putative solute:sodium symporter small subunit
MAPEIPADGDPVHRHQIQTLILAVGILLVTLVAAILPVAALSWLNRFGFLQFPLAFYLLAQGFLFFIVVIAFWFIRVQERIDLARAESEEWVGR